MPVNLSLVVEILCNGIFTGSIYALMALGFSLIWGILDLFNLGHGALYMMGAYLTWILVSYMKVNLLVSIVITFVIMFFVGIIIEVLLIRPLKKYRGSYDEWMNSTTLVTLGVAIFLEASSLSIFGGQFRSLSPLLKGVVDFAVYRVSYQMIISFSLSIFLILVLWRFLKVHKLGLAMQAMSQDNEGAQMVGINPNFIYPLTFGISSAFAGSAGSLLAPIYNIYPDVGWNAFLKAYIVVVIGGLGNISGTIFAGFLLGLLESFSDTLISSRWTIVISFTAMTLVLILKPKGLFGIKEI